LVALKRNKRGEEERVEASAGSEEPAQDRAELVPTTDDAIIALEQERNKYLELLQRTQADFENYRKRMQREMEAQRRYAALPLARDVLAVLDNLHRAVQAAEQSRDADTLIQGVTMVARQLDEVLERHDVRPIDALGQTLDPNLHEAVGARPSAEHPPHAVLEELERGYQMHDRVVRPSKVIVAQPPEHDDAPQGGGDAQDDDRNQH
jgi:molecular chaperone GrpE